MNPVRGNFRMFANFEELPETVLRNLSVGEWQGPGWYWVSGDRICTPEQYIGMATEMMSMLANRTGYANTLVGVNLGAKS